jgi:hypothetical protein
MLVALLLAVCGLQAGTIDPRQVQPVTVGTGDRLLIQFGIWNFPGGQYPADILVSVVSEPGQVNGGAQLEASLVSLDGDSTLAPVSSSQLGAGLWSGAGYSGSVGVAQFGFRLSPSAAADLFGDDAYGVIVIENAGEPVTLGLSGVRFRQSYTVTLAGGSRTVGAAPGDLYLEEAAETPDPATLALCGMALLALGFGIKRYT